MRKLFIILFLIPFVVFSQTDSLNQTDGNGLKQGRWKKFYLKGGKRYVGQFKDDKPIGTFFYYDELGKMTSSLKHKGDTAYGKFFHINGKLLGEGIYVNQKKQGEWRYYDNVGLLSSVENYNLGKLHGEKLVYYTSGAIARKEVYVEGLIQGEVKDFFEDGIVKYEANYIDGNPDSTVIYYHPNGKNRIVGRFKDAVRHGKWTYYNDLGVTTSWEFYRLGDLVKAINKEDE